MADEDFIPESADGQAENPSLDTFDAIDAALSGEAGQDDRVSSGVPDALRTNDDDFLAMSGIAPAESLPERETPAPEADDSLNFYESGVEDVDAIANPASDVEVDVSTEADIDASLASPVISGSRGDLKDIMADLGVSSTPPAPESIAEPSRDEMPELLDQVKADIIGELRDDISSIKASAQPAPAPAVSEELPSLLEKVKSDIIDGLQEDLSALKQGQREAAEALRAPEPAVPVEEETSIGSASPKDAAPELAEAERLIQELQQQPRDSSPEIPEADLEPIDLDAIAGQVEADPETPQLDGEFGNERDATVYGQAGSKKRRKGSRKERFRRRAKRYAAIVLVVIAVVLIGWPYMRSGWNLLMPSLQSPDNLFAEAEHAYEQAQPIQASKGFQSFHQEFPNDPRAESALFKAGYVLLSAPPNLGTQHFRDAVALFDRFETMYPESERIAAVEGMKGLAYHMMGEHEQAITLLTANSKSFTADESMAIPMLRTLARSHVAREEFEEAENRLRQAASMRSNFTVDQDYSELADISVLQAKRTPDRAEQAALLEAAEGYVDDALRSNYIDQQRQSALEKKRDQIRVLVAEGVEVESPGVVTQGETTPLEPDMAATETGEVSEETDLEPMPESELPILDGPAEVMEAAPAAEEVIEMSDVNSDADEPSSLPEAPPAVADELPADVELTEMPSIPEEPEVMAPEEVPPAEETAVSVEANEPSPTITEVDSEIKVLETTATPDEEALSPEIIEEAPALPEGSMTLEAPAPK